MKNFRSSRRWMISMSVCVAGFLILAPVIAADPVTRGTMFTVSILGKPATAYYVWFTGTSAMSGLPGDQPPVIVANTERVVFDPDGGPYVIGSYQYSGGNGRTILADVAPSSDTVSNTRYYAKVTTDSDGYGIVQFQTSSATADRTFTIKAQNPGAPSESVPVVLGVPTRSTTITTVATVPKETTPPRTETTTLPPVTIPTMLPVTAEVTPAQTTLPATTRPAPPDPAVIGAAVFTVLFLIRRA